ncbi:hypothetical protein PLICRDRAFT_180495 [Plicaturopsis crispa FD-325 SS-3]|uniref:F-box domain-containing protein n=1 Tax=Plicaturopsis crispa FD-325 SS-3 TaxID=944288 RepID=A0A0C9SQ73_PLICR|nr:hypothetical protein PLICRDRAFT_180495 [Plicaturopsis crispa FD-325 SS-3]
MALELLSSSKVPASAQSLPTELVLRIFDLAASSSKASALALCLVASWVRADALRHLLAAVTIHNDRQLQAFTDVMSASSQRIDPAAVQHVWLALPSPACALVARLTHLTHLAITVPSLFHTVHDEQLFGSDGALHITVLPTQFDRCWFDLTAKRAAMPEDERSRVFERLTHLHTPSATPRLVRAFPGLTHLAMPLPVPLPAVGHVGGTCGVALASPVLRVLVLVVSPATLATCERKDIAGWVRKYREEDPRVYVLESDPKDLEAEWMEEVKGGDSVWDRAVRQTQAWVA